MNLLLLLSALLSALGGMGQAVRGGRPPQAVCASAAVSHVAVAPSRSIVRRPTLALPRARTAPAMRLVALPLLVAEPIFAGRRRE